MSAALLLLSIAQTQTARAQEEDEVVEKAGSPPIICIAGQRRCYEVVRPSGGIDQQNAFEAATAHRFRGRNGVLSNLQSLAEYTAVVSAYKRRHVSFERLWVAGYRGPGGRFFWSTGASLTYNRFYPGENNNVKLNESALCFWREYQYGDISPRAREGFGYLVEYAF